MTLMLYKCRTDTVSDFFLSVGLRENLAFKKPLRFVKTRFPTSVKARVFVFDNWLMDCEIMNFQALILLVTMPPSGFDR